MVENIFIIKDVTKLSEKDFYELIEFVSDKRKEKILKYRRYEDKCRSLIAAISYRSLICKEYNIKNSALLFEVEEKGKIICINKNINVKFNISHSGDYVALILGSKEVGIDVEKIGKYDEKVAKRFFHHTEYKLIENSENKEENFYRIWTLKEAYVKYLGLGMYKEFDSFRAEFLDDDISYIYDNNKEKVIALTKKLEGNYFVSSICSPKVEYKYWNLNEFIQNAKKTLD